jgi:hypothetical protein
MKKTILFLAYIFIGLTAIGQSSKTVEEANKKLTALLIDPDQKGFDQILSPDLVYVHSSGIVDTKASLIESLVSAKSDFVTIDISDQKVQIKKNIAIITQKLTGTTNNGGTAGKLSLYVMLVWVKEKGQWLLKARHATKV